MSEVGVRISAATPQADLESAVWPGVTSVIYPHVEAAEQIQHVDAVITRLERLRGIRPGTVAVQPVIDSPQGVTHGAEIAASSPRVRSLEVGTTITLELGDESLEYARAECDLQARAQRVLMLDPFTAYD